MTQSGAIAIILDGGAYIPPADGCLATPIIAEGAPPQKPFTPLSTDPKTLHLKGSPWGPANPQALNRYSYVLNNPLRYTDPTGHTRRCDLVGCAGVVYNHSSQPIVIHGDRRIEGCNDNSEKCFENVSVVLQPGESSKDYGFVDVDFIRAVDNQHPLAGRGTDWRYKIGDATVATVVDDGQGGIGLIVNAPVWAYLLGLAGGWEQKLVDDPVKRPKCVWKDTSVDITGKNGGVSVAIMRVSIARSCSNP